MILNLDSFGVILPDLCHRFLRPLQRSHAPASPMCWLIRCTDPILRVFSGRATVIWTEEPPGSLFSWFSWTKVHPREEKLLPSFFHRKSKRRTPETYMEIRNWISKKFPSDRSTQIELRHLSKITKGELDARQEVMEFLDYWGLINSHPCPKKEPATNANEDYNKVESEKNESLILKLFKLETMQSWTPTMSSGLPQEAYIVVELMKYEDPSVEYHCNSCSTDCSRKRYYFQKQADLDLRVECYTNGKFDSNMSPLDFIVMESPEVSGANGGEWTYSTPISFPQDQGQVAVNKESSQPCSNRVAAGAQNKAISTAVQSGNAQKRTTLASMVGWPPFHTMVPPSFEKQLVVGFDYGRIDSCRLGKLRNMQLASPNATYFVDVIGGGHTLVKACKPALDSNCITKDQKGHDRVPEGYMLIVGLLADPRFEGVSYVEKEEVRVFVRQDSTFWTSPPLSELMARIAACWK